MAYLQIYPSELVLMFLELFFLFPRNCQPDWLASKKKKRHLNITISRGKSIKFETRGKEKSRFFSNFMKQSLTRYIATIVQLTLNKLSITRGKRTWRQGHFARTRSGIN